MAPKTAPWRKFSPAYYAPFGNSTGLRSAWIASSVGASVSWKASVREPPPGPKVDRLGEENVHLRQDLIRTQAEVERLREQLALRDENLLLRLQQLLAERLLPTKRR